MSVPHKLAKHVEPDLPDARIERQWSAIASRLDVQRPLGWRRPLGVAAVAAVLLLVVLAAWPRRDSRSPFERARLESYAGPVSVALGDGSRIDLEPQSRLRVVDGRASHVRLDLERGGARFDVTRVAGRVFEVSAAGLEVEVVGTRFGVRVGRDHEHVAELASHLCSASSVSHRIRSTDPLSHCPARRSDRPSRTGSGALEQRRSEPESPSGGTNEAPCETSSCPCSSRCSPGSPPPTAR